MNFLYCLDKNYNIQALMSFYTLNKHSNKNLNIFIAHKQPESLKKLLSNFKLEHLSFKFIKIDNTFNLPNLQNSHVTEATYYRMFAINLIKEKLDHIIYIDSDILFNSDPVPLFDDVLSDLYNSKHIISANTIGKYNTNDQETNDYFDYLNIDKKYFNAGVLIYDLDKYFIQDIGKKLEQHLINFNKEAKYWDQDILNTFFNGEYLELPKTLNNTVVIEDYDADIENLQKFKTLHFAGKTKPWHIEGLKYPLGKHFQNQYKIIFEKNYFISPFDKKRHLKELYDLLKNKKKLNHNNFYLLVGKSVFNLFKF